MTLTTHAAAGMIVAQVTNSPILGFFLAMGSHYLADAIPHGDEFIYWRHVHNPKDIYALLVAVVDFFLLVILLLAIINYKSNSDIPLLIAATIGAILPDILMTIYTESRNKFKNEYKGAWQKIVGAWHFALQQHIRFHAFFHDIIRTPIRFRSALIFQLVFVIGFVYFTIG